MPSRVNRAASTAAPLPWTIANTVSPSNGVCAGRIARRGRPAPSSRSAGKRFCRAGHRSRRRRSSCWHRRAVRAGREVVGVERRAGIAGCGGMSPGSASSAAHSRAQSGRTTEPQALTATIAPTVIRGRRRPPATRCRARLEPPRPWRRARRRHCRERSQGRLAPRIAAEPAMRRLVGPVRRREVEVEEDRRRDDRHARRADRKPRPPRRQPSMTPAAASSPKAEPPDSTIASTRSTRCRAEQLGLAAARRAAAHIDRRDRRRLGQHHRRSGDRRPILGLPDQDAGHVGDQIARPRSGHRLLHFRATRATRSLRRSAPRNDARACIVIASAAKQSRGNKAPTGAAAMSTTVIRNADWVIAGDEPRRAAMSTGAMSISPSPATASGSTSVLDYAGLGRPRHRRQRAVW